MGPLSALHPAGIHVLRTGRIEANLPRLLEEIPVPGVRELIAAKVRELASLPDHEAAPHTERIAQLRRDLDEAFEKSALPESAPGVQDLDAYLIRLRLPPRFLHEPPRGGVE